MATFWLTGGNFFQALAGTRVKPLILPNLLDTLLRERI
jgi:hypothetical protein